MSDRTSKDVVSEVREVYGRILDRDAHGTGHYEGCWKDHWACLAERLLDHIARITPDETTDHPLPPLTGQCSACGRGWKVQSEPRVDLIVTAFHCPCGQVTRMNGDEPPQCICEIGTANVEPNCPAHGDSSQLEPSAVCKRCNDLRFVVSTGQIGVPCPECNAEKARARCEWGCHVHWSGWPASHHPNCTVNGEPREPTAFQDFVASLPENGDGDV